MLKAHISNSVVDDVISAESEDYLASIYHPDYLSECRVCDESVQQDWTFDGESFAPPSQQEGQVIPSVEALRTSRNAKLVDCDWTQLSDALPDAKRKAWAKYRQALRDLPTKTKDLSNVVWPKTPEE